MIEQRAYDDVTELRFTWWRSRAIGMSVNAFLVRGVLVDSGFPAVAGDVRQLLESAAVNAAIITHHHEDHAGNAGLIAERGLPVAMAELTRACLEDPEPIAFYRRFTWTSMNLSTTRPAREPRPLHSSTSPDPTFELVHAPGHSPDHHVVWDSLTDTLFSGDLFLGVKVRVAHADSDPRAELRTLHAMIERNPARMFCGHRGYVANPVAALRAKADWTEWLIDQVERRHVDGRSEAAITRELLGSRGAIHWFSRGEYSSDNLVRAIVTR